MSQEDENDHAQLEAHYRATVQAAAPLSERRICVACGKRRKCRQRPTGLISFPLAWFCR